MHIESSAQKQRNNKMQEGYSLFLSSFCSSVPFILVRLALSASRMNQIQCSCDLLHVPEQARWHYLARSEFSAVFCLIIQCKYFIDQACLVKMAGYWPHSFFASLWTLTHLSPMINMPKKNTSRPSWLHFKSITYLLTKNNFTYLFITISIRIVRKLYSWSTSTTWPLNFLCIIHCKIINSKSMC